MTATPSAAGIFAVSLDLELFWGMHDRRSLSTYAAGARLARQGIPRLLELFAAYGIRSTWAIVGLLFFEDRDELLQYLPERRPAYREPLLSPYHRLAAIGANEREDPCHYGLSLVRRIMECPGQEIGTHTFSHFYCLEDGQTPEDFRADLVAAQRAAARLGITLRSLVFPRNQVSADHLRVARDVGLTAYRGTQRSWLYRGCRDRSQHALRRGGRLADSFVSFTGHHTHRPQRDESGLVDIPASRLLRRVAGGWLDPLHLKRIKDSMTHGARTGTVHHLWFHPDGFGTRVAANLAAVRMLLDHFRDLRDGFGMQSQHMGDIAQGAPPC